MKTAYIFSGQGAQAVGMGKDLYESSPAAKSVFDRASAVLGWDVAGLCFNGPAEQLTETKFCQAAIYTMSMACFEAWRERKCDEGTEVAGCAGLSLGEYAAFCAAGAFSFEDGLKLLEKRSLFMDEACRETPGGMASILGGDNAVIAETAKECGIWVANYNCPGQTVISGSADGVQKACEILKSKGVKRAVPLKVAGAFHSGLMQKAGEKLSEFLKAADIQAPRVPVAQNYTGSFESDPEKIRKNLELQVSGSVKWEECVRTLIAAGAEQFIEFGPGNVLTGLARRIDSSKTLVNINSAQF